MVYIRLPTWKTTVNPSTLHRFNQEGNYTPTQKMMLTRNRIWGNIIGSNDRSGWKELKKPIRTKAAMTRRYQYSHLNMIMPFFSDWARL